MDCSKTPPATPGAKEKASDRRRGHPNRRSRGRDANRHSMIAPDNRRRDAVLRHRKTPSSLPLRVVNHLLDEIAVTARELDVLEGLFVELLDSKEP
jgi:hypothetical protein